MAKDRYFYATASFMRKDKEGFLARIDFTIKVDNGTSLFPLMKALQVVREQYPVTAEPATIQFDSYIEISKEDYEAYNMFKNFKDFNFPAINSKTENEKD